jgi:hypothetical protein
MTLQSTQDTAQHRTGQHRTAPFHAVSTILDVRVPCEVVRAHYLVHLDRALGGEGNGGGERGRKRAGLGVTRMTGSTGQGANGTSRHCISCLKSMADSCCQKGLSTTHTHTHTHTHFEVITRRERKKAKSSQRRQHCEMQWIRLTAALLFDIIKQPMRSLSIGIWAQGLTDPSLSSHPKAIRTKRFLRSFISPLIPAGQWWSICGEMEDRRSVRGEERAEVVL